MSTPLATYSFLPWLRQGLSNRIAATDLDPAVTQRATVRVDVEVTGQRIGGGTDSQTVGRDVEMFGPGDIIGIDRRAIVRVEPRDWATNFEPNYLPHVEFYDEDFPWRYTPAAPDVGKGRLRPWIALIVLSEAEFADGRDLRSRPLAYIDVPDADVFPPSEQLWAWAHVHVNASLAASASEFVSTDMTAVLPKLRTLLWQDPDRAYSRLLSPRKLGPNEAYHAFVMPVFESGRLAGLGRDPSASPSATHSAWRAYPGREEPTRHVYYYRWFFRTGATGDFESLVRLLEPKPADARVGSRPVDVQAPGANLPGITDPNLTGVLRLGGALRVPRASLSDDDLADVRRYERWDQPGPHPFQDALARLVNLADSYQIDTAQDANQGSGLGVAVEDDPDPLVTPPLYGRWHALQQRLLHDRNGDPLDSDHSWVHDLNLDPMHRMTAGFGTQVVQQHQEEYMDAAWRQIGDVLEANRRIRLGQVARDVSAVWHAKHLAALAGNRPEQALHVAAPVTGRVLVDGVTVRHRLAGSLLQPTLTSVALRRAVRPCSRLTATLFPDTGRRVDGLLTRAGAGEVSAAPPRGTPAVTTPNRLAERLAPEGAPGWLLALLRRWPWLRWVPWLLVLLLAVVVLLALAAGAAMPWLLLIVLAGAVAWWLHPRLATWAHAADAAAAVAEDTYTPGAVERLPGSPDFTVSRSGEGVAPRPGRSDSADATRFKTALREAFRLVQAAGVAGQAPARDRTDPAVVARQVVGALDPRVLVPRRVLSSLGLPDRVREQIGESFVEAMAYPELDIPMYEPLAGKSAEMFLPNINRIETNSITLLESNRRFIEAYMVGLNHEFARELLWREYPTDQRGSYFRQFWDASGYLDSADAEARREQLRDIPPLHRWPRRSSLGSHRHRDQPPAGQDEVVIVVRGELLKRYPNAVVYAHRACWQRGGPDGGTHPCLRSGDIDPAHERRLVPLTPAEEGDPPRDKVRTPLYEARVEPDIHFFGFDLTEVEARGGSGDDPADEPGWFFVLEERPGEPRFGLDIDAQPTVHVWNDLSWDDVQPGLPGSHLLITPATTALTLTTPTGADEEKRPQHDEDRNVAWNRDISSAALAYVLLQTPVRMAVHASEMLRRRS
jgi:hypothetical protein